MTDTTATPDVETGAPDAPADVQPATEPAAPEVPDWAKDPAAAFAEVQKARQEAAAARTASRDTARAEAAAEARTALLKELGLVQNDEPADPKALAADLNAARAAAQDAARELAIYRHAPNGINVQALLDSRTFVGDVAEIDPTDTTALVAAIEKASSNPRFKTTQAAATSGVDLPGGNPTPRTYTRAQLADPAFYKANRADILAASREGRIR